MIGRPMRHVDRLAEGEQLHRDQSLVVIAGEHAVELAARRAHEHGVGRESVPRCRCPRRGRRPPPAPARRRPRCRSRRASPACGLRPASARRGCGDAEPRQRRRGEANGVVDQLRRDQQPRHLGQRHVHGDQHHLAAGAHETSSPRARTPQRCASRSVWPFHGRPAWREGLLVDRARSQSHRPRRAGPPPTARNDRVVGGRPAAADTSPDRESGSLGRRKHDRLAHGAAPPGRPPPSRRSRDRCRPDRQR